MRNPLAPDLRIEHGEEVSAPLDSSDDDRRPPRDRRRRLAVLLAVAALILCAVALLKPWAGDAPSSPTGQPTAAPRATVEPTATSLPTTTPRSTRTPSAAARLAPFLSAAGRLDGQLREASTAIGAAGPPWTSISPGLARTVTAADLRPVARRIPPGLPQQLQEAVILVYSDLSSRRHAMDAFDVAGPFEPPRGAGQTATAAGSADLRNGRVATARFPSDLAALRSLAATFPPPAAVSRDSHAAAEVLLQTRYVELANAGCGAHGGAVVPNLPTVVWRHIPAPAGPADGRIGGIEFIADFDRTWHVELKAC
jgi:hypothetical protein